MPIVPRVLKKTSSLSKAHTLLCAFVIAISIMFISVKVSHLKRKENLVYQQRHQFLMSSLFDTNVFFNVKKGTEFLLRSRVAK